MDEPVTGWKPPPQPTQPDWSEQAMPEPELAQPAEAQPAVFAGWGRRLAAYLLDSVMVWAVAAPALIAFTIQPNGPVWVWLAIAGWVAAIAYFPFFWTRGSTPAMKLLGIRVVRAEDGGRIGGWRAVGRSLAFVLASLPLYLGLLWAIWDRQRRGWHDMMAKTFVTRAPAAGGRARALILTLLGAGAVSTIAFYVVILTVGATFAEGARDSSGRVTGPQDISVFGMQMGDCFDVETLEAIRSVHVVPCDQGHVYEAYAQPRLTGPDYPGDTVVASRADEMCVAEFEPYVGTSYETSDWLVTYLHPSRETWANGDRDVVCALHNSTSSPVTGSARNSAS
ncbi:MAG TPA: RDD family protein [Candidatus Limnocylindrales bacterium]|nr:RDD family protein [Candidatus Limnocylindrales bacterium]